MLPSRRYHADATAEEGGQGGIHDDARCGRGPAAARLVPRSSRPRPLRWWDGARWTDDVDDWASEWGALDPSLRYRLRRFTGSADHDGMPTPDELAGRWPATRAPSRPFDAALLDLPWVALAAVVVMGVLTLVPGVMFVPVSFYLGAALLPVCWWATRAIGGSRQVAGPGRDEVSVIGPIGARWGPSPALVSGEACLSWSTRLQRRTRLGWSTCWEVRSAADDLVMVDGDGERVVVRCRDGGSLRWVADRLVDQRFEVDGRSYRLVEIGVTSGADVVVTGSSKPGAVGGRVLCDDRPTRSLRPGGGRVRIRRVADVARVAAMTRWAPWVVFGVGAVTAFLVFSGIWSGTFDPFGAAFAVVLSVGLTWGAFLYGRTLSGAGDDVRGG